MAHRILTSLVGIDATFSSTLSLTSLAGVGNRMLIVNSAGTVSTQAIPTGTVTSVATAGLISGGTITSSGTITTSMNTNKLVGRSTAGVGIMEEITVGSGLTLTGGTLTNTATPTPLGYYGAWQDDVTQSAPANNTGVAMIIRTADMTPNGISIVNNGSGNPTRITFAYTGVYNLQFSSQFQNTDTQLHDVTIWLRMNGSDVDGTAGFISVPNSHGGTPGHNIAAWNYLLNVVGGQYYEIYWSTDSYTNVTMQYYAAGSPPPAAASVILTVTQQSGIMAGTGITAINSLTGAVQTLGVATSGTDFNISSSGTAHTFNLPTASATNRGALSSTDWTTFNNKQNALTNPITGTGTTNYLSKFTGSTALGNSVIYDDGTNIGIGTASPGAKLDISTNAGRLRITQNTAGSTLNGLEFAAYNSTVLGGLLFNQSTGEVRLSTISSYFPTIYSNGAEVLRIPTSGNVLINTTTDSGYKLDVNGTARVITSLQVGNFTPGVAGAASTILTQGRISASGGITFYNPAAGDNQDVGFKAGGNGVAIYINNGIIGSFGGYGASLNPLLSLSSGFNPSSGTGNKTVFSLTPTYQTSGTFSGGITGILYNPALSTLTGVTYHRAIETVSGDVIFGTTSGVVGIGTTNLSTEANLYLGAKGTTEGGQLILQKGTAQTYATHLDNYTDQFRIMYGTDTGSTGIALAVSMSTKQLILPAYTTTSSFSGTVVGYLAFDSSGNVLTVTAPSGAVTSVNAGTGVSVSSTTGNVTVSIGQSVATSATPSFDQVFATNNGNGTNFKVGDDAWIGDINVADTLRVMGQQNAANGYIVFGNSNATALGRSGTGALTYGGYTIYHSNNSNTITALGTITTGVWNGTAITDTYISSASTWNAKQNALTLTTTGTSGAATLVGSTLNIPQYQSVITNPVTGTGTTNYMPKWTSSSALGNSLVYDDGTNIGIGTTTPGYKLDVNGTARIQNNTKIGNTVFSDVSSNLIIGIDSGTNAARAAIANASNYQDCFFVNTSISSGNVNMWSFGQRFDTYFGNTSGSFQIVGGYVSNTGTVSPVGAGYRVPIIANPNGTVIIAGASNAVNGNVLIGTTTDGGYKLYVNGSGTFVGELRLTGNLATGGNRNYILGSSADFEVTTNTVVKFRNYYNSGDVYFSLDYSNGGRATFSGAGATGYRLATNGPVTASSALAQGISISNSLIAAANNDVLVGLDVNPTFTNGAFTGVVNYGIRTSGDIAFASSATRYLTMQSPSTSGSGGNMVIQSASANTSGTGGNLYLYVGGGAGGPGPGKIYIGNNNGWDVAYVTGILTVSSTGPNTGDVLRVSGGGRNALTIAWDNLTPFMSYSLVSGRQSRFLNSSSYYFDNNFLIGTTTDGGYKLNVNGNGNFILGNSGYIRLQSGSGQRHGYIQSAFSNFLFSNNIYYDGSNWRYDQNGYGAQIQTETLSVGVIAFNTFASGTAGNVATIIESMRIVNNGNILMGTTTDSGYKLDVNGTSRFTNSISLTGSNRYIGSGSSSQSVYITGGTNYADGAYFNLTGNTYGSSPGGGSAEFVIRTNSDSKFALFGYNGSSWSRYMTLFGPTGNLNIGYGTSDTGYKLRIQGDTYNDGGLVVVGIGSFQNAIIQNYGFNSNAIGGITSYNDQYDLYTLGNGNYNGETINGELAASVAPGQILYLRPSALSWDIADASSVGPGSTNMLGIACGYGNATDTIPILLNGYFASDSYFSMNFNFGVPMYLSSTSAGNATTTVPSSTGNVVRILGHVNHYSNANGCVVMRFNPDNFWVEL